MSFFNSITQDVKVSVSNNSSTPLNAGLSFTGVGESTLNVGGIQINFICDQNCTIQLQQSMDPPASNHWDIVNTFNYKSTMGGVGLTFQATAAYFRVIITNVSTVNATTLRLQSVLCPVVEAVPQSLDENGNFKTVIRQIVDRDSGNSVGISAVSELRVSEHVRLVGAYFGGAVVDPNFWAVTPTAGGTATQGNGEISLNTLAGPDGGVLVQSQRISRYISGAPNYIRMVARVPALAGVGANVRRWGAFDASDGVFFSTNGTTLSLTCRKGGSDANTVSSGSFNGTNGLTYVLNANVHVFEIYYENSSAYFYIDGLLIHKFTGLTSTLYDTLHLKIGFENQNSGGNADLNTLLIRVASINRIGQAQSRPQWRYIAGVLAATVLKYGPGTLHSVQLNKNTGTSVTLYDSTNTGAPTNPICIIDPSTRASMLYGLDFYTGLIAVAAGAGIDCTVVYE